MTVDWERSSDYTDAERAALLAAARGIERVREEFAQLPETTGGLWCDIMASEYAAAIAASFVSCPADEKEAAHILARLTHDLTAGVMTYLSGLPRDADGRVLVTPQRGT